MAWLLVTGAGLVAETVIIVLLGRTVTARYDAADTPPPRHGPAPRGNGQGSRR